MVVAKLIMNITNFNRKKTRYALIAALSIGLSAGSAAFARNLDFKLINDTGYDIHAVYVDPNKSELWTDDVMEHDILPDGSSVFINFTGDADTCIWDLMVEWTEDYDSTVWYNLNLCDISEVTLKYNRNTDETTAFTKGQHCRQREILAAATCSSPDDDIWFCRYGEIANRCLEAAMCRVPHD